MSAAQSEAARGKTRGPYVMKERKHVLISRGVGKIMCRVCGTPIRDHDGVGPCPHARLDGGNVVPIRRGDE